jgi:hypothetical protein
LGEICTVSKKKVCEIGNVVFHTMVYADRVMLDCGVVVTGHVITYTAVVLLLQGLKSTAVNRIEEEAPPRVRFVVALL